MTDMTERRVRRRLNFTIIDLFERRTIRAFQLEMMAYRELGPEDYERLLALDENVKKRGLDPEVIEDKSRVFTHSEDFEKQQCVICMDDFEHGRKVRELGCGHRYHRGCIDRWFRENTSCPICKHDLYT